MPLAISLFLPASAFAPGEPVRPEVVITNSGDSPCMAPTLDGRGHSLIRFTLTGPDGEHRLFPLPDDLGALPPPGAGQSSLLPPGANVVRSFQLAGASAPGPWELRAELRTAPGPVSSEPLRWFREAPAAPATVVAPNYRGAPVPAGLRAFFPFQGDRLHALYACSLVFDDDNAATTLTPTEPERLFDLDPGAHSFSAVLRAPGPPNVQREWLAWLTASRLHAAVDVLGFQHAACTLPFPPAAILAQVASADGGFFEVLVSSADRRQLAVVQFSQPVPAPLPGDASFDASPLRGESTGVDLDPPDADDDEDEDDEPLFPVDMAPPRILWTHHFDQPFSTAAYAAGSSRHPSLRSLCLAFPCEGELELRFAAFPVEQQPSQFTVTRIAGGPLLPRCPLAMAIDRSGSSYVAAILQSVSDSGRAQALVVRTSFDRHGPPRLDGQTVYQEAADTPTPIRAASLSLFVDDSGGPWHVDWCVLFEDASYLASSRLQTAERRTAPAAICDSLQLLSFEHRFYLAAASPHGPVFIDCV